MGQLAIELAPGAGWLGRRPAEENFVGQPIDREKFPTRYEEYHFAASTLAALPAGTFLDAGSGFNPEIHILPLILGGLGWHGVAVDKNYESLSMPTPMTVTRWVYDITHLWKWQGGAFDVWLCISTLEHFDSLEDQLRTFDAAFGILKPGGYAILTADILAPARLNALLRAAGFEVGPIVPTGTAEPLRPPVAWAVGRKPL